MNPFTLVSSNLPTIEETRCAALKYLCDIYAAAWTPVSYANPFTLVKAKINTLAKSPLREEMLSFLSHHEGTWRGPVVTP